MTDNKNRKIAPGRIISLNTPQLTLTNRARQLPKADLHDTEEETNSEDETEMDTGSDGDVTEEEAPKKKVSFATRPGSPPRARDTPRPKTKRKKEEVMLQTVDSLLKPEKKRNDDDEDDGIPMKRITPVVKKVQKKDEIKETSITIKLEGAKILDASYSDENNLVLKLAI